VLTGKGEKSIANNEFGRLVLLRKIVSGTTAQTKKHFGKEGRKYHARG